MKYFQYFFSTLYFLYFVNGASIDDISLSDITKSSSDDDVKELVIKLGNGVLDLGVDAIIKEFNKVAGDILDDVEDTLKQENVNEEYFARIGKSANRLLSTDMGPDHYGVDFLQYFGNSEKVFDSNSTKFLLNFHKAWSKLASDMKDADSVDSDTKMAICICTIDHLVKLFQDTNDCVKPIVDKLLETNNIILTDDLITTHKKFRKAVKNLRASGPKIVNTGVSYIADAKSGNYKGKDTEGTLKSLKASQYRQSQKAETCKTIKRAKDELKGQEITFCDVSDAMKQKNSENLMYKQMDKLSLNSMTEFLSGTSCIASSKLLQKLKKDHSDAQKVITSFEDVSNQVSNLWLSALMSNLKRQICIINSKNMDDYFQLAYSTITDVGKTLEQVHKAFGLAFDLPDDASSEK